MRSERSESGIQAEFITIARVLKPQGRRGEVAAELHTDFPERFAQRKRLYALATDGTRRELELEAHWLHKDRVILKFRGMDSISAAEELAGCEIQVPAEQRVQLDAGTEYISDLVGCKVFEVSGQPQELGLIADVLFGAGEAPLLEVRGNGREFLIPFAEAYVKQLDRGNKRLEVVLPGGLLELDAPYGQKSERVAKRKRH